MSMRDLLEHRGRVLASLREITEHPEDNGDLSDDHARKFDALKAELGKLEQRIERQAIIDEADRRIAGVPLTEAAGGDRFENLCRGFSLTRAIVAQIELRAVDAGPENRGVAGAGPAQRAPGARHVRAAGRPGRAAHHQRRRLADHRLPTRRHRHRPDLFIEVWRPASVVASLGGRVITGLRENLAIPKAGTGPEPEWVDENEMLSIQHYTFDQVLAEPHIWASSPSGRRLMLQSSPEIEGLAG